MQRDETSTQIIQKRMGDANYNAVDGRQEVYDLIMSMLEMGLHESLQ